MEAVFFSGAIVCGGVVEGEEALEDDVVGEVGGPAVGGGNGSVERPVR
jgi:hypothetical protein